jgi:hypothetical protein
LNFLISKNNFGIFDIFKSFNFEWIKRNILDIFQILVNFPASSQIQPKISHKEEFYYKMEFQAFLLILEEFFTFFSSTQKEIHSIV